MMSPKKAAVILAIGVLGIAASDGALAWSHGGRGFGGGHARFGLFVGAPLLWGSYWGWPYNYPPYYYPPSGVAVPPQTYVEQAPVAAPAAPQPGYWYYCAESRSYYPYVNQCPGGWQRVSPQPPG